MKGAPLLPTMHPIPIAAALLLSLLAEPLAAQVWEAVYPPRAVAPGEEAVMTIEGRLPADSEQALVPPVVPALPSGIEAETVLFRTTVDESGAAVAWRLVFTSDAEGTFALPAVALYFDDSPDQPVFETEAFELTVREPVGELWFVLAAGLVAGGVTVVGIRRYRRQERGDAVDPSASPAEQVQQRLHEARRHRLDGDFYAYYLCLSRAAAICGRGAQDELGTKLKERARQVGYQGLRPSDDELDSVFRDVEKALRRFKEERAE